MSKPSNPPLRRQPTFKQRTQRLVSQREILMAEIALRTSLGAVTPMIAKAHTLLTRFWGAADWSARAELLPVARWMLQLDATQLALVQSKMAPRKRRQRKDRLPELVR